jgi:hypothetical protein
MMPAGPGRKSDHALRSWPERKLFILHQIYAKEIKPELPLSLSATLGVKISFYDEGYILRLITDI